MFYRIVLCFLFLVMVDTSLQAEAVYFSEPDMLASSNIVLHVSTYIIDYSKEIDLSMNSF